MALLKKIVTPFLLGALFLSLAACQKKTSTMNRDRQMMRICLSMNPSTIDTRKNAEVYSSNLQFLLFEGLTRIKSNGEGELALAKSVDISEDGLIYVFHLRDAYWTDGEPITAYDFEYSWKKILTPQFGSPCPHLLFVIKNAEKAIKGEVSQDQVGIRAIDPLTLQVILENPTPYFLSLITFCNFYPIPKHIELKNPSWQNSVDESLVCSGPFKMIKWVQNQEIQLKKNLTYWDAENVHLDGIQISIVPDGKTALQMFENGDLDFVSSVTTPLSMEDLAYFRKQGKLKIIPIAGLLFCTFNLEQVPFNNANIRKALGFAIDRVAITENIAQLSEIPATCCVPPVLIGGKNRELFKPFDPELARKLLSIGLAELGLPDNIAAINSLFSQSLILYYSSEDLYRRTAQAVQQQWKSVLGLEVQLREEDYKTHLERLMSRNYSLGLEYCVAQYNDPINILDRFKYKQTKKNLPGFENKKYIDLLNRAASINNAKMRLDILQEAEFFLMSEMPLTPIFHFNQGILINPKYTDVEFSPLSNLLLKKIRPPLQEEKL
ncbi:MAG: peptide ABC transporter substrate-binding protein [Chlamydiota bacterium]